MKTSEKENDILVENLVEETKKLCKILNEIIDNPSYNAVLTYAHVHGVFYNGPVFGPQLEIVEKIVEKL